MFRCFCSDWDVSLLLNKPPYCRTSVAASPPVCVTGFHKQLQRYFSNQVCFLNQRSNVFNYFNSVNNLLLYWENKLLQDNNGFYKASHFTTRSLITFRISVPHRLHVIWPPCKYQLYSASWFFMISYIGLKYRCSRYDAHPSFLLSQSLSTEFCLHNMQQLNGNVVFFKAKNSCSQGKSQ